MYIFLKILNLKVFKNKTFFSVSLLHYSFPSVGYVADACFLSSKGQQRDLLQQNEQMRSFMFFKYENFFATIVKNAFKFSALFPKTQF